MQIHHQKELKGLSEAADKQIAWQRSARNRPLNLGLGYAYHEFYLF